MKTKPAQIRQDLADRCEAIARKRRATPPHPPATWSGVMAEALDVGLKSIERRGKEK